MMNTDITYYKRNLFLSCRGLLLLSVLILGGFMCTDAVRKYQEHAVVPIMLYALTVPGLMVYSGYRVHYFGMTDTKLILRNIIFFWQRREVLLSEIKLHGSIGIRPGAAPPGLPPRFS